MAPGKFKDKSKKNSAPQVRSPTDFMGPVRVRIPQGREVIGILSQRVGGSRMFVSCMDGKTRNCRVPGRHRRGLWLREGDVILVEPWEFDNEKGDVIFKYTPAAIDRLKKMGKLNTDSGEF